MSVCNALDHLANGTAPVNTWYDLVRCKQIWRGQSWQYLNPLKCWWWLIQSIQNYAKRGEMTETLAYGYSCESAQWIISDEYQHDGIKMPFKNICILLLWMKVASTLYGSTHMVLVNDLANTKWCKKNWKWQKHLHMGIHLTVLSDSYLMNTNMAGVGCISKTFASLCGARK